MTRHPDTTYHRLRRLQEQNRSNIPAMIAQRAMNTFALQPEPAPEAPLLDVRVVVYPQDPFIGSPEVRQMNAHDIRPGLMNSRIRIQDSVSPPAQPDAEGNYLYWPGSQEFDQVNAFYYATFTLRMYERYARRALPWAFPAPRIGIDPHAGEGANAFYNEQDHLIGFYSFQVNGTTFNTAQSADIASHETAHAVLDGIRDLHNESFGLGPLAFHESFGDMSAVLVALHDDSLVKRLLEWTKDDLHVDNFIATVAEHISEGVRASESHVQKHTAYLRNALNKFTDVPFDSLPYAPASPETELGHESHNYSRLFSGAFYDLLVEIYDQLRKTMPNQLAIHRARDILGYLLVCAVELGPVGELDFSDMAKAFLTADSVLENGAYADVLTLVFDERGILSAAESAAHRDQLRALPDVRLPQAMNNALDAALFLENVALPALKLPTELELTPMSAYRNAAGYAYVTYFNPRRITLDGAQFKRFNGSHVDAFGGLTLMFDAENRLRSACLRLVTDEDVRQIRFLTAELIEMGHIEDRVYGGDLTLNVPLHMQPDVPKAVLVSEPTAELNQPAQPTDGKIVKLPVIFDTMPKRISSFFNYLEAWRKKQDE
jgi:hypothetical protein